MYIRIEKVNLNTGEEIEIGLVAGPDSRRKEEICSLLAHKGHPWTFHVEKALDGTITDLQTRFYLGILGGHAVSNICLFEHDGVAILAHVYTKPEFRQRGIARQINRIVMEDFRQRGGRVLTLSTEYDSHPFRLYASFGFKEIISGVGNMTCELEPGCQQRIFAPGSEVSVRDQVWADWPHLNLLYHQSGGDWFRSVRHALYRPQSYERCFLEERVEVETLHLCAKTLVTEDGVVVGNLACGPDPRWYGAAGLVDLHVHENYAEHASRLLDGLACTKTKLISHARPGSIKERMLRDVGYVEEGRLTHFLCDSEDRYDVVILARNPC
jgi:predicted GNAT family acetyltransferase